MSLDLCNGFFTICCDHALKGRCFITCFYKMLAMKTYSHFVMSLPQDYILQFWYTVFDIILF